MSELLCLACRLRKGYQVVLGAGLAETAFGWSHSVLSCGKEMRKRWWVTVPGAGLSLSPTLGSHKPGATEFDQGLCTAELEYSQVCPSAPDTCLLCPHDPGRMFLCFWGHRSWTTVNERMLACSCGLAWVTCSSYVTSSCSTGQTQFRQSQP